MLSYSHHKQSWLMNMEFFSLQLLQVSVAGKAVDGE